MKKTDPRYVIGFMVVLCVVFGAGVAGVHYATQTRLAANEALLRNRVIVRALDLPVTGSGPTAYEEALASGAEEERLEWEGRATAVWRRVTGEPAVAFEFRGLGFWDTIRGILVLTPALDRVLNIGFFEQHETPGLGARIEEPWFKEAFRGLKLDWSRPVDRRIVVGPTAEPSPENQVDAITGATQTSMALMRFLNAELAWFHEAWTATRGGQ